MAHIILHMDQCLDQMRGNASTGRLVDLKTAYHALDTALPNITPLTSQAQAHELLEDIQQWLCDGGTYENGAANQAKAYTDACNKFL